MGNYFPVVLWLLAWMVPLWFLPSTPPGAVRFAVSFFIAYAFIRWAMAAYLFIRSGVLK